MSYFLSYVILCQIYVILAFSANLMVGVTGIFSVSHAAIFGIGAYTTAIAMQNFGITFWLASPIAMVCCLVMSIVVALPSLRVTGDYFVVTSFGLQLTMTSVFLNWDPVTGGMGGKYGIEPPEFFGLPMYDPAYFIWLSTAAMVLACLVFSNVLNSPFGRILSSIREDEEVVASLGKDVVRSKVAAAAVAGTMAGFAGSLYGPFISFIDPQSFDIHVSIMVITMLIIGGARTVLGSVIGPFLLLGLPQILSLVDMPLSVAAPLRQLVYGLLLILFMLYRPQGLVGKRI